MHIYRCCGSPPGRIDIYCALCGRLNIPVPAHSIIYMVFIDLKMRKTKVAAWLMTVSWDLLFWADGAHGDRLRAARAAVPAARPRTPRPTRRRPRRRAAPRGRARRGRRPRRAPAGYARRPARRALPPLPLRDVRERGHLHAVLLRPAAADPRRRPHRARLQRDPRAVGRRGHHLRAARDQARAGAGARRPPPPAGIALLALGLGGYGIEGGLVLLFAASLVGVLGQIVSGPTMFAHPARVAPQAARGALRRRVAGDVRPRRRARPAARRARLRRASAAASGPSAPRIGALAAARRLRRHARRRARARAPGLEPRRPADHWSILVNPRPILLVGYSLAWQEVHGEARPTPSSSSRSPTSRASATSTSTSPARDARAHPLGVPARRRRRPLLPRPPRPATRSRSCPASSTPCRSPRGSPSATASRARASARRRSSRQGAPAHGHRARPASPTRAPSTSHEPRTRCARSWPRATGRSSSSRPTARRPSARRSSRRSTRSTRRGRVHAAGRGHLRARPREAARHARRAVRRRRRVLASSCSCATASRCSRNVTEKHLFDGPRPIELGHAVPAPIAPALTDLLRRADAARARRRRLRQRLRALRVDRHATASRTSSSARAACPATSSCR